jgi:septum site-determining protein MinD
MTQIISFVSGKGGVGKTTLVSNLGAALTQLGKQVLVIDGNLSGANLGIHLGLSNFYPFSLNDVLKGNVSLTHAIYRHYLGFDVIPASMVDIEVNPRRMKYVLSDVVGKKDFILIDSAAGIDNEVRSAIEASDKVIIVTNPEMPAIVDALRVKALAEKHKREILGIVVNKVRKEKFELTDREIEEILGLHVISKIPNHKMVRESIAIKNPVFSYSPHSPVSGEISRLSHMLAGEEPPKLGLWHKINGFFFK